jgi:hypothetical protein
MSSKKVYIVFVSLLAMLWVLIFGGAYVGNKLLSARGKKIVDLHVDAAVINEKSTRQTKSKQILNTYSDLPALLKEVIPKDKDQAGVIRQITNLAKDSGFTIKSVIFPASSLGVSASTAPTADGSTPSATPAITQSKPVAGAPGVYSTELTIEPQIDGKNFLPYAKFQTFLQKLETNRRIIQTTSITITPVPGTDNISGFQIKANVFYKP